MIPAGVLSCRGTKMQRPAPDLARAVPVSACRVCPLVGTSARQTADRDKVAVCIFFDLAPRPDARLRIALAGVSYRSRLISAAVAREPSALA